MDCDDQVRLVKCDDHADAGTLKFPGISGLSVPIAIEFDRVLNDTFDLFHRCPKAPKVVLGMPGQPHIP